MAGKKSKRAQAHKADPEPASQLKKPLAPRAQAENQQKAKQHSAKQQPAKPQPRPAVENTNSASGKTKFGDKTGGKTGNKADDKTRRPQKKRQKNNKNNKATRPPAAQPVAKLPPPDGCVLKKRQPNESTKGNKPIHPPAAKRVAKLPLPEGYIPEEHQEPNRNNRHRGRKAPEMAAISSEPRAVHLKPAEIDATYPVALNNECAFNHNRVWHSMVGKNPADLAKNEFLRADVARLRWCSLKEADRRKLHNKFWKQGQFALYKAIEPAVATKGLGSAGLFVASAILGIDESQIAPVDQLPGLLGLLRVAELRSMIINLLAPSIGDLTALALTCKRSALWMKESIERWDTRSASFSTDKFVTKKDAHGRVIQAGGIQTKILVVSPASAEPVDCKKPYMADFMATVQLCGAMSEIPLSFQTIVLDNLPFLSVELFELMVNTMPNLKNVTVTRCVMLDVTKLEPLLDVVKRHPRAVQTSTPRPASSSSGSKTKACNQKKCTEKQFEPQEPAKKYIALDFAPFFFRGPYSADRRGCYGVTHNEPTFHTPKAVFALIIRCWPLAQEVGMDLLSDSSSFWSFVRQLPGPDALWAIKAREALVTRDFDIAATPKDTPHDPFLNKFADDLTAALTGDNHKHPKAPLKMARFLPRSVARDGKYWRRWVVCRVCEANLPLSLFPVRADTCWACKMRQYVVNMEDSHLRLWIESAMTKWLSTMKTHEDTLPKLLDGGASLAEAFEEVQCADWVREHYLFSWQPTRVPYTDPVTGWDIEPTPSYCPPTPKTLSPDRASLARWRSRQEPTAVFDYRHGGPQREDPCKSMFATSDSSASAEESVNFKRRWQWTLKTNELFAEQWDQEFDRKLKKLPAFRRPAANNKRDAEFEAALRRARVTPAERDKMAEQEKELQDHADRGVYLRRHHHVEDCLVSLGTPGKAPFCKDAPVPDPSVSRLAYDALRAQAQWSSSPYGHVPTGFW